MFMTGVLTGVRTREDLNRHWSVKLDGDHRAIIVAWQLLFHTRHGVFYPVNYTSVGCSSRTVDTPAAELNDSVPSPSRSFQIRRRHRRTTKIVQLTTKMKSSRPWWQTGYELWYLVCRWKDSQWPPRWLYDPNTGVRRSYHLDHSGERPAATQLHRPLRLRRLSP